MLNQITPQLLLRIVCHCETLNPALQLTSPGGYLVNIVMEDNQSVGRFKPG